MVVALVAPAGALAAAAPPGAHQPVSALGSLAQLSGSGGCLVDRSQTGTGCTRVRALSGPAPFLGSHALAISPDGRNVYVASSRSHAIAVFTRNGHTGALSQKSGTAGCIALAGANGCARAVGLAIPNSLVVSPDGKNVYATSVGSNAVVSFRRNPSTGALTQLGGGVGCIANAASRRVASPAGRSTVPTGSRSVPTGTTSTWRRSSAAPSRSSPATRRPAL